MQELINSQKGEHLFRRVEKYKQILSRLEVRKKVIVPNSIHSAAHPRPELGSKANPEKPSAYPGLWFGKPFDTTHGPELAEGFTIPSEAEEQTVESKR